MTRFSVPVDEENEGRAGSGSASNRLEAHEVSMEEYADLAKRLDTMESSVGLVMSKVVIVMKRMYK